MEHPCFEVADANCRSIAAQNGYVNLGFYDGASLDDPALTALSKQPPPTAEPQITTSTLD